jgi:ribosome-associated toxin RatA of RatAB toxin-antitoxin module
MFELAWSVEAWPRLLPHYRWVKVLDQTGADERVIEMAAWRPLPLGPGVPVWWRARQTIGPANWRIHFDHIQGVTRGMHVEWRIEPASETSAHVQISHRFSPDWPVPDRLVGLIVGEYFVNAIAWRTLATLGDLAERRTHEAHSRDESKRGAWKR